MSMDSREDSTPSLVIEQAKVRTSTPGTLLVVSSLVMFIFWFTSVGVVISGFDLTVAIMEQFREMTPPGSKERQQFDAEVEKAKTRDKTQDYILNAISLPLNLAANILVMLAGIRMKSLNSYTLCMVGTVFSIIPLNSCCCVGLPIGIWALVTLLNADVKRGFQAVAGGSRSESAGWSDDLDR